MTLVPPGLDWDEVAVEIGWDFLEWNKGEKLILLGRRVVDALALKCDEPLCVDGNYMYVPHPIKEIAWWMNAAHYEIGREACEEFLKN
jgi:hypothetical protein